MTTMPDICYATHPSDGVLILIKRDETGYYNVDADKVPPLSGETVVAQCRRLNERLGVTTAERMAMEFGSLAGWTTPGADVAVHRSAAFAEDMETIDPALGGEVRTMIRSGATYEAIKDRFEASMEVRRQDELVEKAMAGEPLA
jgi:hypothetical protein